MNHPRNWFGPKRVGMGYGPSTWEGWVVVALFAAFCLFMLKKP
ncbi:hypothetical protein [Sphingobium sp.]|nr:hypothetical protein [Sphingobium sp.]